eukprot:m.242502 g.242502  ORF g.242502 m.242502 type:complete len:59 (-) comp34317_c0_seq1:43-219(-)
MSRLRHQTPTATSINSMQKSCHTSPFIQLNTPIPVTVAIQSTTNTSICKEGKGNRENK